MERKKKTMGIMINVAEEKRNKRTAIPLKSGINHSMWHHSPAR
jgi:hypothetical protein